jgi:hypothetical protein
VKERLTLYQLPAGVQPPVERGVHVRRVRPFVRRRSLKVTGVFEDETAWSV